MFYFTCYVMLVYEIKTLINKKNIFFTHNDSVLNFNTFFSMQNQNH